MQIMKFDSIIFIIKGKHFARKLLLFMVFFMGCNQWHFIIHILAYPIDSVIFHALRSFKIHVL